MENYFNLQLSKQIFPETVFHNRILMKFTMVIHYTNTSYTIYKYKLYNIQIQVIQYTNTSYTIYKYKLHQKPDCILKTGPWEINCGFKIIKCSSNIAAYNLDSQILISKITSNQFPIKIFSLNFSERTVMSSCHWFFPLKTQSIHMLKPKSFPNCVRAMHYFSRFC